jgi:RNA polymerase sigma factor (sigma-70 family)
MTKVEQTQTTTLSDNEIIARVLGGEKRLYEVIMRRYNQRLYRICMSIVGDSTEAEEIMQISYISAYEHLRDFGFKSAFGTWLTRITINESLQFVRRRNRHTTTEIADAHDIPTTESPLQSMMNTELRNVLESALAELPEKYRLVFMMREVEEMSIDETKECLNLTESNVKIRLSRAKEMLRQSLSQKYKTEELYGFHLTRCDRVVEYVMGYVERF